VSNESRTTQSTISLVNGKLQLLKPRKYDHHWPGKVLVRVATDGIGERQPKI